MIGDTLMPIFGGDKNRNEIIVVEYDGFIKNITEGYLRTFLREIDEWINKYPGLDMFKELDPLELYEQTSMYDPLSFFIALSDSQLTADEVTQDLKLMEEEILVDCQLETLPGIALSNLIKEKFVKAIYIIKSSSYTDRQLLYLSAMFDEFSDKIHIMTGGLTSIIKDYKPTSVFISDTNFLINVVPEDFTNEELKNIMFFLRNSIENCNIDDDGNIEYLYADKIKEINDSKLYGILRLFCFPMNEDNNIMISLDDDEFIPDSEG